MYTRIVVPLDGSDVAERALPTALEMAHILNTPLHLVRVVDLRVTSFAFGADSMLAAQAEGRQRETERALATEYLCESAVSLSSEGVQITTEVRDGLAPSELVQMMRPGDLFVVSSHGRSGIARWYLGSVAEQVVRQATVPVMVIRGETAQRLRQRASFGLSAIAR